MYTWIALTLSLFLVLQRSVVGKAWNMANHLVDAWVEYRTTQGPTCLEAFIVTGPNGTPLDLPLQPI